MVRFLRTIHRLSDGQYEELPDDRQCFVDLDIDRVTSEIDRRDMDFKVACSFIIVAYRMNTVLGEALKALVDAKQYKDLFGKTPGACPTVL